MGSEGIDGSRHVAAFGRNNSEIGRYWQGRDVGIGEDSGDRALVTTDRHDRALEPPAQQIAHHHVARGAFAVACADHCHRLRIQHLVKVAD